MTDRELMQQALEKLEFFDHMKNVSKDTQELITALRERLAQPEQKPLTDEQIERICCGLWSGGWRSKAMQNFAHAIEAAHGIGENK